MRIGSAVLVTIGILTISVASCGQRTEIGADRPPVVRGTHVERVSMSSVDDYYEATGTVRSKTTTVLSSKTMGTILSLRVREGDRVRVGQVLVEIDDRDASAQLQKANAGLRHAHGALAEIEQGLNAATSAGKAAAANRRLAESTYARYQALLERKSISPQEFDEVKARKEVAEAEGQRAADALGMLAARKQQALAQIDQAKAEIANAQVFVSHARIVSPISGVVVARQAEVGSTATPGAPLLTIEDSSRYRLDVAVEESQLGKIRIGQQSRLRIDALGTDELTGSVSEITAASDPMTRSYTVKIDVPAHPSLRSGSYGTARFVSGQRSTLLIPRNALVQRGQLVGVFVVDDTGIARLRLIKTGRSHGDGVEALSGLSEGERIVVDTLANVNDGVRVQ